VVDDLLFGGGSLLAYLTHPQFEFHKAIEGVLGYKADVTVEEGIRELAEAIQTKFLYDPRSLGNRNAQFIVQ